MLIWQVLGVAALVVANGFFVAAEFALVKLRAGDVPPASSGGSPRLVHHMLGHLDAYLSACQLGITLASLGLGWAGEPLVARMLEPAFHALGLPEEKIHFFAFPVAFFLITFLHLTVGEQAPKIAAIQKPRPTSLLCAYPLAIFYTIFKPFIWFINVSSNGMLRAVGFAPVSGHDQEVTEEELRLLLAQSAAMGHLDEKEQRMMTNILDLEEKSARSCMIPRSRIVFLDQNDPMERQLEIASKSGHSRLPLCDGRLEKLIGVVHVKDLFAKLSSKTELASLTPLARKAPLLPETIRLDHLLEEFRRTRNHLAILVNEHGGVAGMITLENVLEEMVGPIDDEFDTENPKIVEGADGAYEVDASCTLGELRTRCGIEAPGNSGEVDTVGGLLMERLGHIPKVGEELSLGSHTLTVLEASPTRALRVLVQDAD